ncbi:MAG: FAD-binding protein [Proteobacteria bacterium]|nr:FAD-binding protein [Pseudomonadota bacterium]
MARILAQTEADVVDAVRAARERKSTLEIVGAGTKRELGRPIACDDVLDLSGLSGIVSYEPDELVITVKAGTKIVEIEHAVARKNQRLGFGPADWGPLYGAAPNSATIGGVLSADASGSLAVRYGRARNHLLGFRAVNGFGEAYKAGGKVVKNVTGFDLPKLMCGAFGTLGALTEVTLRLVPSPARAMLFAVRGVEAREGLELLRRVWSSPLEATGLACIPAALKSPGMAIVRLEGTPTSLAEKTAILKSIHAAFVEGEADIFEALGNGTLLQSDTSDIWRLIVAPAEAGKGVDELSGSKWYADSAGGVLWLAREATKESAQQLHEFAARAAGTAVLARASREVRATLPVFSPEDETRAALTSAVKSAFDPLQIFNPGRMYPSEQVASC